MSTPLVGFELKAMMHEREQALIFDEWLNGHKALLFKVVHAYAFTPADRDDLFQDLLPRKHELESLREKLKTSER